MIFERDAVATRARLLNAASAEFAAYGIAGARIDRIASTAQANKQLIYAYFGNKSQLFEAVIVHHLSAMMDAAPFDVDDLASYVGQIFDYLVEHPDVSRLAMWANLERPASVAAFEQDSYKQKLDAIAVAQRDGRISTAFAPADLLALMLSLATAWFTASDALRMSDSTEPWSRERLAQFRAAMMTAARRVLDDAA